MQHTSITTAIAWPVLPPLIQLLDRTLELVLPQPLIHLVVLLAQPFAERGSSTNIGRVRLHVLA